ncbi:MAG: tetratricopeptide repeat protein, partial [Woeseiaceae bacterium]|nr:tetratricopeptide repeat protein [Woeseiaceae bacterium]
DGRAFSDDPLNKCIAELRRQLGDRAGAGGYIETIPKRGYRLAVDVQPIGAEPPKAESRSTRRMLRAGALSVLLALAAFGIWRLSQDIAPSGDVSIAVLPFDSVGDPEQTYFADGVHENLIARLSRAGVFDVRSRTSTLQYRDRSKSLPQIADELGVDKIVEGSVRQDGDTVRVTAHLVRASDDHSLWSATIEKSRTVANLFEIQDEIADEVARALHVDSSVQSPADAPLPTDNFAAYEAFLLGKFHYRRKLTGDIEQSVLRFEEATHLDPEFAEAFDWLAHAYNHAATEVGHMLPKEAYPKARAAALRALELQPDLATAHSILGYIRAVHDRDWIGAVADLERALQLEPNDSGTVWSLAHVYSLLGQHDEALRLTRDFAARAPTPALAARRQLELVRRLLDAQEYEQALDLLDRVEAGGYEPWEVADARGIAYFALGRLDRAAASFELAVQAQQRSPGTVARLAHVQARLGQTQEAQRLLDELIERSESERISRLAFATVQAGIGNNADAIADIAAAVENGGREVLALRSDPFFNELAQSPDFGPEFRAIIDGLGLPDR